KRPRTLLELPPFPTRRSSDLGAVPVDPPPIQAPAWWRRGSLPLGLVPRAAVAAEQAAGVQRGKQQRQPAPERRIEREVGVERKQDRKSTRLNSSHVKISYAVF